MTLLGTRPPEPAPADFLNPTFCGGTSSSMMTLAFCSSFSLAMRCSSSQSRYRSPPQKMKADHCRVTPLSVDRRYRLQSPQGFQPSVMSESPRYRCSEPQGPMSVRPMTCSRHRPRGQRPNRFQQEPERPSLLVRRPRQSQLPIWRPGPCQSSGRWISLRQCRGSDDLHILHPLRSSSQISIPSFSSVETGCQESGSHSRQPKNQIHDRRPRRVPSDIVERISHFVVQTEAIGSRTWSIKVYNRSNTEGKGQRKNPCCLRYPDNLQETGGGRIRRSAGRSRRSAQDRSL